MNNFAISSLFRPGKPVKSLEFFPPKTGEDTRRLFLAASRLRAFQPDFVSVTYGAGGTTRRFTQEITARLQRELKWLVMPHLTCVGSTRTELRETIQGFVNEGVRNIMTLRGDPPKGSTEFVATENGFRYASDLVAFIKKSFPEICMGVAGYPEKHPEAPSAEDDINHLKFKVDQGADFITTQLFYDNQYYYDYVAKIRAQGIKKAVLPGILPVLNADQVKRFGITLPGKLEAQLTAAGDDKTAQCEIGMDWATEQIAGLLDNGAPGVHLYIMNRSKSALGILDRLKNRGYFPDE
ncbi:MAG: methylenetetrahydrofolate reductase [NAD(P)H] [Verrucomicrobiales bacterium]|nr:methylenetetrahydrofolate reductase [NAD(P)H] [Verrucomicrobiales bacterium]